MDDIKAYIQEHLKTCRTRGLDMTKLLDASGMSRAKFYKCLKEPWRFSDDELGRIAQKLQLDEQDCKTLFAFKHGDASNVSIAAINDIDEDERAKLYPLVEKIIFGNQEFTTDCSQKIYKIFHEASANLKNEVCSADEFAKHICDDMNKEIKLEDGPQVYITICNSCSDDLMKVVYSLLKSLNNQPLIRNFDAVSMTHFIGRDNVPLEEKLGIYAQSNGLMRYGRYELMFTNPYKRSIFEAWNGMLMRYTDSQKTTKYLMISIYAPDDATVFTFSDNNLFEFFRYGATNLFWEEDPQSLLSTNALELGKRLVQCRATYPTISFGAGICLDHILPELYDEKASELVRMDTVWNGYDKLLEATGAQELSGMFSREKIINMLLENFKQRFYVGENAGMVNLLCVRALQEFSITGKNIDMERVDISFDCDQRIRQLEYVKKHLDGAAGGQSYYLINSTVVPYNKIVYIVKGYRVAMVLLDTVVYESYLKSQIDWDTTDIFYDYVMEHLLSDESRSRPDSPIMSKELAEEFIDNLINKVKAAESEQ